MKYVVATLCLFASAGLVYANPQDGEVVVGEASIQSTTNGIDITQASQEAWIDWSSFNIAQEEWVNINQLLDNGLTVNRVTGDDASEIFGTLTSNGTVYLINPNGVLFSETSRVDVGSLFVTDHWLSTDGSLNPSNKNSTGIQVHGEIRSREELTLLAENVNNSGSLISENVELLGSKGALLQLDDQGHVTVLVPAETGNSSWVENTGAIVADGQVFIGSPQKNDWLNNLASENNVSVAGGIRADSVTVQGSNIDLNSADITADLIDIESQQNTFVGNSTLTSVDEKIRIRGENIQLHSSTNIDVGSGELTIGGNYQGQDNDHNADFVHVSSTVSIYGNGGETGNGGEIILWSDGTTSFHGSIEAEGGALSGHGGFVEVSGKETLVFRGDVSTSASHGDSGLLLLDPDVITIADGSGASTDTDGTVLAGDYAAADITIYEADLEALSAATSISLAAEESIIIEDLTDGSLTLGQTGSVTFDVVNNAGEGRFEMLDINDSIEMTGGGDLNVLVYGNVALASPSQTATVILGDVNFTSGGDLVVLAAVEGSGTTSDDITMSIEDITITGDGTVDLSINNSEAADVGTSTLDVGNITISGTTGVNNVTISSRNDNQASGPGLDTPGAVTLNLNGDLDISGTGHTVTIETEYDAAVGGTINSYGDITANGSAITLSTGIWELLDADTHVHVNSMTNFAGGGGGIDLSGMATASIDGNGNNLTLAGSGAPTMAFDEFTNVNFLFYRTDVDISLGTAGIGSNISNADLANLSGDLSRFSVQSAGSIEANLAVIDVQTSIRADRDNNGTGSVILNGLNTTGTNLTLSGADISGSGVATNVGAGTVTFDTNGNGQAISVNGSETYNIEATVWNNITTSGGVTIEGVTGGNQISFEHGSLGSDVTLDGSTGGGVVVAGGAKTYAGANTLQLVGDVTLLTDITMSNASSMLDIDGALTIGEADATGGDSVSVSAIWDTVGITSISLEGDAGDSVALTHIEDSDFSISTVTSSNSVSLDLFSNGSITAADISVGDLLLSYDDDNDQSGSNMLTVSGVNSVNGFTLSGSNTNDHATWGGTWSISGAVNVIQTDTLSITNDSLTAASFNFPAVNTISFGAGSTFSLASTVGDISLADFTSDRRINMDSAGTIHLSAITTSDDRVDLTADDVEGDGSAINLGAGVIEFQVNAGTNSISIGDLGTQTYNVEGNIWDNLTVGSILIDSVGGDDTVFFYEDSLPADLTIDGPSGTLVFDGVSQSFVGASLTTNQETVFLQDFTSDSVLDINGAVVIGEVGGGDVSVQAVWEASGMTGVSLAGDAGDTATVSNTASGSFTLPVINSANDVNLVVNSIRGVDLVGVDVGNLTVNLDTNDNGGNPFTSSGNFSVTDLTINGTLGIGGSRNDSADIDGAWTIGGNVNFNNLDDVSFLNDAFLANGNITLEADTTLTLGTSITNFALGSTNGNILFDDVTSNRPMTITAAGSIIGGYLDAASRAVLLTSDSDNSGDELISLTDLRAGDLTMSGDFHWNFDPVLSGDYVHTVGDVQITDATISAFSVDLTSADSVSLSGTLNAFEARGGDVDGNAWLDSGTNSDLTVRATNNINLVSLDTNGGDVTLEADSDSDSTGMTTLSTATGGLLNVTNDLALAGGITFSSIVSTGDTEFNDAMLTVDSFDSFLWNEISFSGTSNSITASAGDINLVNATDSGTNAALALTATGAVSVNNVITGSGDVDIDANSDATGSEAIVVNESEGGNLTLNTNVTFSGTNVFTGLVSSDDLVFNNAVTSVNAFDSTSYSSVSFTGTQNTLNIDGGDLVLDTPTVANGSNLSLNVGAGSHRLDNLNAGSGDINIGAVNSSVNQIVTAEGDWLFSDLNVSGIDTFVNNAQLFASNDVSVQATDDIILNDGSTVNAYEVLLDAGVDVTVTGITATSEQIPSVIIRAGGDLFDGGDSTSDIDVFWVDAIEYDVAGNSDGLETVFNFSTDLDNGVTELAAISDESILTIADDSESDNPLDSENASVGSLPKNRVDVFVPQCSGNDKNCRKNNAVRKFLSALLIGGALPQ